MRQMDSAEDTTAKCASRTQPQFRTMLLAALASPSLHQDHIDQQRRVQQRGGECELAIALAECQHFVLKLGHHAFSISWAGLRSTFIP